MAITQRTFSLSCGVAPFLPGKAAANERIHVGMIGLGGQATAGNLQPFIDSPDTRVLIEERFTNSEAANAFLDRPILKPRYV